jgi:hypothetical protein
MEQKDAEKVLAFEIDKKLGGSILSYRLLDSRDPYIMNFELKVRIGKATVFAKAWVENLGEWDYGFEIEIPSFKVRPDGIRLGARELVKIAKGLVGGILPGDILRILGTQFKYEKGLSRYPWLVFGYYGDMPRSVQDNSNLQNRVAQRIRAEAEKALLTSGVEYRSLEVRTDGQVKHGLLTDIYLILGEW